MDWSCYLCKQNPPGGAAPGERREDMFNEMNYSEKANYGISTVYGLINPKTQEVIIVSDLRRHYHGEYVVERGNIFGVKAVWSNLSKSKCIEKAKKMGCAAG